MPQRKEIIMTDRDYRQEAIDFATDEFNIPADEFILADGLEEAFLGLAEGFAGRMVPVYDFNMCIQILVKDGMTHDEALEYFHYNTLGAYYDDNQPIFLHMNPKLFKPVKTTRVSHLKPSFSGEIENCPEDWWWT